MCAIYVYANDYHLYIYMAWLLLGQLSCQCWCPYSDGIWHGICTAFIVPHLMIVTLYGNKSGDDNVAIGNNALRSNTTGCRNIGFGVCSLYKNTTGCFQDK